MYLCVIGAYSTGCSDAARGQQPALNASRCPATSKLKLSPGTAAVCLEALVTACQFFMLSFGLESSRSIILQAT